MKTKLLVLLFFVPVHVFLSLTVLQRGFNPPPGGNSAFFQFFSAAIMSPLLLPLVMFDPDGERLPKWIQFVSVPLNSLVWGIGLLLLVYVMKRWRRSHAHG
jgi:hypothetical protein